MSNSFFKFLGKHAADLSAIAGIGQLLVARSGMDPADKATAMQHIEAIGTSAANIAEGLGSLQRDNIAVSHEAVKSVARDILPNLIETMVAAALEKALAAHPAPSPVVEPATLTHPADNAGDASQGEQTTGG